MTGLGRALSGAAWNIGSAWNRAFSQQTKTHTAQCFEAALCVVAAHNPGHSTTVFTRCMQASSQHCAESAWSQLGRQLGRMMHAADIKGSRSSSGSSSSNSSSLLLQYWGPVGAAMVGVVMVAGGGASAGCSLPHPQTSTSTSEATPKGVKNSIGNDSQRGGSSGHSGNTPTQALPKQLPLPCCTQPYVFPTHKLASLHTHHKPHHMKPDPTVSADPGPPSSEASQPVAGDAAGAAVDAAGAAGGATTAPPKPVVLVSCGSFNPPTVAHMRMCEVAVGKMEQRGYTVLGVYLSPVGASYGKPGLAPVCDRVTMCEAACVTHPSVMCDRWEPCQASGYTRTRTVLKHVQEEVDAWVAAGVAGGVGTASGHGALEAGAGEVHAGGGGAGSAGSAAARSGSGSAAAPEAGVQGGGGGGGAGAGEGAPLPRVRVALLCGADVLASMEGPRTVHAAIDKHTKHVLPLLVRQRGTSWHAPVQKPGVWEGPDALLREHGVVCVARPGTDAEALVGGQQQQQQQQQPGNEQQQGGLLAMYRQHIEVVSGTHPSDMSSTKVRAVLQAGQSVAGMVPPGVEQYLRANPHLYRSG